MLKLLRFLLRHPLSRADLPGAALRFLGYQTTTRLREQAFFPWIAGTQLLVRRRMHGVSGNIYCGLHEYGDMGFALHFLRPGDLFVDVGANVGSWTILAAGVCGADSLAIEANARTAEFLAQNVTRNGLDPQVRIERCAVGNERGEALFTSDKDTENRIARAGDSNVERVPIKFLDDLVDRPPALLKLDVEGFEVEVLGGADTTLAAPSLKAVSTELADEPAMKMLTDAGFTRMYYDPATRILSPKPNGVYSNNALMIRDVEFCQARVREAPVRKIYGTRL